jgi:phage FluMu gp28-like protein
VREVLAAVNALLIWGGRVRVISTHNGVGNPFNAMVMEARAGKSAFKLHRYTFDDAVRNGLYERVCLKRGAPATAAGKAEWEQLIRASYGSDKEAAAEELDCVPRQGGGAWLSFEVITQCEHEDAGKPELYQGGPVKIGNDIARRGDLWIAWVWERVGDVDWCREISVLRNATFAEHDAEMDRLVAFYRRVVYIGMDQTGMGEKPVEDAQRRYSRIRVEGVQLVGAVRLNIATIARQSFEDRKVRIPAGQPELRADLHKLKRVAGDTGQPRLIAERDAEGHADRFWAAVLGLCGGDFEPGLFQHLRAQVEASEPARKAYEAIRAGLAKAKDRFIRKKGQQ